MSQFSGSILADEDRYFDAIIGGVFYCSDPPDRIEKMKIKIDTKSFLFAALTHLSPFILFGFCSLLQIRSNQLLAGPSSTAELKVKGPTT